MNEDMRNMVFIGVAIVLILGALFRIRSSGNSDQFHFQYRDPVSSQMMAIPVLRLTAEELGEELPDTDPIVPDDPEMEVSAMDGEDQEEEEEAGLAPLEEEEEEEQLGSALNPWEEEEFFPWWNDNFVQENDLDPEFGAEYAVDDLPDDVKHAVLYIRDHVYIFMQLLYFGIAIWIVYIMFRVVSPLFFRFYH